MLSIFLLMGVLDERPSIRGYFKRRVLRIWPIYFLFMGVAVVLCVYFLHSAFDVVDLVLFATFTSYFAHFVTGKGPLAGNLGPSVGPFWTLQLEEFVYLLIPVIHRWGRSPRVAYAMIIGGLGWVLASNALYLHGSVSLDFWKLLWYAPPTWMAAYGFGLLAYLRRAPRVPGTWLVLFGVFALYPFFPDVWSRTVFYPVVLLCTGSMLMSPPNWLARLAPVGEVSYGLYASQGAAYTVFGASGILAAIPMAICVELPLRYRTIRERLLARIPSARIVARRRPR
jgi:peptidoglycan/LPS O-acetylase OafA/YrhL